LYLGLSIICIAFAKALSAVISCPLIAPTFLKTLLLLYFPMLIPPEIHCEITTISVPLSFIFCKISSVFLLLKIVPEPKTCKIKTFN
jgi:hypothetical protein